MFNVACPRGTTDPVDCSLDENRNDEQCKTDTGGDGENGGDENGGTTDKPVVILKPEDGDINVTRGGVKEGEEAEEDGGGGYLTWLIVGIVIVFLAVCGFASYKIYMAKRGPSTIKVQDLSPQNHGGKGNALSRKKEPSSRPKKEKESRAAR